MFLEKIRFYQRRIKKNILFLYREVLISFMASPPSQSHTRIIEERTREEIIKLSHSFSSSCSATSNSISDNKHSSTTRIVKPKCRPVASSPHQSNRITNSKYNLF
eukprot:Sdes_comp16614_c0_seq1m5919